jgi:hypothetical protein
MENIMKRPAHSAITIVFIDNHLYEDDHYRPKHIGQVSYIYKLLPLLLCSCWNKYCELIYSP